MTRFLPRPFLAAAAALCLFGLDAAAYARPATRVSDVSVTRSADGAVRVTWRTAVPGAPVDVYLAGAPGAPLTKARRVSSADRDGVFEAALPVSPRPYFEVVAGRRRVEAAERVLPLEGGRNFRDLGGYATEDGRRVRWGKLYRSGTMNGLTDGDYAYLRGLGIQVICDFRGNDERTKEPTLWPAKGRPQTLSQDYDANFQALKVLGEPGVTPAKVKAYMGGFYRTLPYDYADHYRVMFKALAAGRTPLAFHCSAGKDRTGVAAGLLLSMLGVRREAVLADYALSDKIVNYEAAMVRKNPAAGAEAVARLPPDLRAPMLASDPEYLALALDEVVRREGSVDNYLRKVLGLSDAELAAIRRNLTEPA